LTKYRGARDKPAPISAVRVGRCGQPHAITLQNVSSALVQRQRVRQLGRGPACVPDQAVQRAHASGYRAEDYAALLEQAQSFLSGRSHHVQQRSPRVEHAPKRRFRGGGVIRDRIRLSLVQAPGHPRARDVDADFIAAYQAGGQPASQVFLFRGARTGATAPISRATTASLR